MYGREGKDFTLAAAGDAIITRRISTCKEDRVLQLVDKIREADAGFVNLETLLHDYEGYPNAQCGGTYVRSPKYIADELKWMGFDLFAAANNHIADYSRGGMLATMETLEDRNLTYAGLGRNLREARSASYLDTPAGNVALISCCSSFPSGSEAGEQRPDLHGRPGLSPLRLNSKYILDEEWMNKIEELSEFLGLEEIKDYARERKFSVPGEDEEGFVFLNPKGENLTFEKGDDIGIHYEVNEEDEEQILKEIKGADKQSDWVLISLHYHEGKKGFSNDHSIPDFAEDFARKCMDAGADVFLGHGSHVMRGIEIYEGKPILYGLGDFFYQTRTIEKLPADMYENYDLGHDNIPADVFDELGFDEKGDYKGFLANQMFWETVLPVIKFEDDELDTVELYPVVLGLEEPRSRRGRPLLAEGEKADHILKKIKELSETYGTEISIEDGFGLIDLE